MNIFEAIHNRMYKRFKDSRQPSYITYEIWLEGQLEQRLMRDEFEIPQRDKLYNSMLTYLEGEKLDSELKEADGLLDLRKGLNNLNRKWNEVKHQIF